MRPTNLRSVPALLLVAAVTAGCGGGTETTDPGEPSPTSTSSTTDEPAGEGPVAGAGADVDPADAEAWCGAVTADQLAAASGWEVASIDSYGSGVATCSASLPGSEATVTWGSETTSTSFDRYAAGFDRPAGAYEVTDLDLGGQPGLVALQPAATTAFAGTVVDGRLVEVTLIGLLDQDVDPEQLGEVARQVLDVYVA